MSSIFIFGFIQIWDITLGVMPEMGGKELARRTRSAFPDMPIILTSGYPIAANDELMAGSTFIQKPFSPKALAEAVREALAVKC